MMSFMSTNMDVADQNRDYPVTKYQFKDINNDQKKKCLEVKYKTSTQQATRSYMD